MQIHASCAARSGHGVLLLGPPGSGKSDLLLRLMDRGFDLVADDRVDVVDGMARAPEPLRGLIELRGLGIVHAPCAEARLALAVQLEPGPRLPLPERHDALGLPLIRLDPAQPSAAQRVEWALDLATGARRQVAGCFA